MWIMLLPHSIMFLNFGRPIVLAEHGERYRIKPVPRSERGPDIPDRVLEVLDWDRDLPDRAWSGRA